MGGSRQKSRLSVRLFDFKVLVLSILKEADINFFFKFGGNKHNKDLNKNCGKKMFFFHRRGVGGVKFGWKIPKLLMFFYWNLPIVLMFSLLNVQICISWRISKKWHFFHIFFNISIIYSSHSVPLSMISQYPLEFVRLFKKKGLQKSK